MFCLTPFIKITPLQNTLIRNCVLNFVKKKCENVRSYIVLGIETSCDDTGCAIVDSNGNILGEALNSQHLSHLNHGGIIPQFARDLHRRHITEVCEEALISANLKLHNIDAIAATVKPGLALSLSIGRNFGVNLSLIGNKPFIPIHHMQAHALVPRISQKVDFPYLVLLISGGHCLLAMVENVSTFHTLGTCMDDAPGEAFDKMARRLKLRNMEEFSGMNGGRAIELAASRAVDPTQFDFPVPLRYSLDCNFSFCGLKSAMLRYILAYEEKFDIVGDKIIPDVYNLCAGFQLAIARHLCHRTQRAMEFIDRKKLLPENQQTLVLSGGVACNNFISTALNSVCREMGYTFVRPANHLCTDNGIMVAWNGVERWCTNTGVLTEKADIENVCIEAKSPLGEDWSSKISNEKIKCKWIKMNNLI